MRIGRGAHLFMNGVRRFQRFRGDRAHRLLGQQRLQRDAQFVDFSDVLDGQPFDHYALVGVDQHQTFRAQTAKGFAHRRGAHFKTSGDFILSQLVAGAVFAGEDVVSQQAENLLFDSLEGFRHARFLLDVSAGRRYSFTRTWRLNGLSSVFGTTTVFCLAWRAGASAAPARHHQSDAGFIDGRIVLSHWPVCNRARSPSARPISCTPYGRKSVENPDGVVTAGKPSSVAGAQKDASPVFSNPFNAVVGEVIVMIASRSFNSASRPARSTPTCSIKPR